MLLQKLNLIIKIPGWLTYDLQTLKESSTNLTWELVPGALHYRLEIVATLRPDQTERDVERGVVLLQIKTCI